MRTTAAYRPIFRRLSGSIAIAAVAVTLVAGCGQDSPDAVPDATAPTTTTSATATPSTPASATPSAKPTRTPTKPAEGSGDDEGDDEPAAAGGGICAVLSEAEVGAVLGGTITGSAIPGGGCSFSQDNPDSPAATVSDVAFAEMTGGMDGAKANATSAVEGDPEDLTGIGTAAFVVTGTSFGGTDLQGAGAVRVGDRLIIVQLAQSKGLSRAKVRALVVNLLKLAVTES